MARIGQLTSQIVTGNCPECRSETLLVSFEPYLYRCVNCGYDLEQKVNGKISYIPHLTSKSLMSDVEKYFEKDG